MNFTDTSEKGFQKYIVKHLTENQGYSETLSKDFDRDFCLNTKQLLGFIEQTQPENFEMIQRKGERDFLLRLDEKIKELGVIEVLRKGVKHYDKTVELFYRQPSSVLNPKDLERYESNQFTVTQELIYSNDNANRLDITIFVNGIPVITAELKNSLSGQTVHHGIRQYQNDRDPKEKIFSFARCMVHFVADTELIYMSSHLKGKDSHFMPFNKGLNNGGAMPPFGSGNPINPNGLKTHYLWEEILSKNLLSNIIDKFAQVFEETDEDTGKKKKKIIFPRYHQLTCVRSILNDAKKKGVGQKYLIQHSAGSGKSNSIAWLAHQLIGLHDSAGSENLFDSVIVVTDRTILDKQLRDTITQFAQKKGVVEAITGKEGSKTSQLREAIANHKKIIICTIQTFPHLLKEVAEMNNLKFGIIIDEAHSSQSGQTSSKMNAVLAQKEDLDDDGVSEIEDENLEDRILGLIKDRKMIKNGSYFAFTATPKNKTIETFGIPHIIKTQDGEKTEFLPFHLYSMKQAIQEEFILDVLQNYTTYSSYYKLIKAVAGNPEFDTKQAQKKLRAYVEGHEFAINEKSKIMIDHFNADVKNLINGTAKTMIVTKSIISAIKYKFAFDAYLKEIKSPYKAIVAFSGSKMYKGIEYTEISMNNFVEHKNDIPKNFNKNEYKFLIVANKYQTGFDQPLLHTMYVDKRLDGVQAVQTLSRLNRAYKPFKRDTFVLDFYNSVEDIKEAFNPYFTATILSEETNPNKLNDLVDALEKFEVYEEHHINDFCEKYFNGEERINLDPIIDNSASIFKNLNVDEQIDFKVKAKSYVRTYSYLAKIIDFKNIEWEKLWRYLKFLLPKLILEEIEDGTEGLLESIDMDSYRPDKIGKENISLDDDTGIVNPIPVDVRAGKPETELDSLENILDNFNQHFGDISWTDKDKVNQILTEMIPADMKLDSQIMKDIDNSPDRQNAKISSDKKLSELMQNYLHTHTEIYKKYSSDKDFERRYKEFIFDMLWKQKLI